MRIATANFTKAGGIPVVSIIQDKEEADKKPLRSSRIVGVFSASAKLCMPKGRNRLDKEIIQ